ncbi:MAG TPA: DUF5683 domain-containing protein, partial [Bacteroidales bacterium]|nr:DUF5683 domain-containing protein [Bacteroidales bacterium]
YLDMHIAYHAQPKNYYCLGHLQSGTFKIFLIFLFIFILPAGKSLAQENQKVSDTTLAKPHSPTRAAVFSAVLPGLGQAYNKKYWKIPIVYAGFGVISYFIISNTGEYKKYKEAFNYVATGDSSFIDNDYVLKYDEQQLLDGKNYYRRNMELSYIIGGLWYILNIIDASVDAHFFDYDVSDDLTLRFDPVMLRQRNESRLISGLKLTLTF